jgi:hypothetical protein
MKYHLLIAGMLVILLLAAGCTDESVPDITIPALPLPAADARYSAGDIVAKTPTQTEPLWLILKYDKTTDKYERALIYRKSDRSWGERRDTKSDIFPRDDMEAVYPVKVAHVMPSSVPVVTPTIPVTTTVAPSGPAPEITGIAPNTGASGSTVTITNLAGENFISGATVKLVGAGTSPIIASQVKAIDTKITCSFNLNGAVAGKRDVVVTNPDGQSATLPSGFTVNEAAPVITNVDPFEGTAGEQLTIAISGSNFKNPAKVLFVNGSTELEGANVEVQSSTQINCVLMIPSGTKTGTYDVIVKNALDRQNGTALKKFTVNPAT